MQSKVKIRKAHESSLLRKSSKLILCSATYLFADGGSDGCVVWRTPFVHRLAKVSGEPILTNAAGVSNVRTAKTNSHLEEMRQSPQSPRPVSCAENLRCATNEWPISLSPCGVAKRADSAIFVLRAHAARKVDDRLGLLADLNVLRKTLVGDERVVPAAYLIETLLWLLPVMRAKDLRGRTPL